jgi:hypothetical protein
LTAAGLNSSWIFMSRATVASVEVSWRTSTFFASASLSM